MGVKSFYKWYIDWYKTILNDMTIIISLPNELLPFKEDNVVIINKFKKERGDIKAYNYLQQMLSKADEFGITIYLEPTPIGNVKTKSELIDYYKRFGFELTPNKEFMKRLPKYSNGGDVIYSAIFFDVDKMLNAYGQVHPNLFSHHSTIEFKPQDISHLPIGEEVMVEVVGRLTTPKVDALIVKNPFSENEFPHITLSTAIGVKPFETNNEIKNNLDKIEPFNDELYGIVGYFDGKSDVTKYDDGGLIAPNGKPSNLTPEQYKLVRTPEFKKFFGDWENNPEEASKVVDENGEPLVVYHATNNLYNEFSYERADRGQGIVSSIGFYFTTYKQYKSSSEYGKIIKKCFLNLRNPMKIAYGFYEDEATKHLLRPQIIKIIRDSDKKTINDKYFVDGLMKTYTKTNENYEKIKYHINIENQLKSIYQDYYSDREDNNRGRKIELFQKSVIKNTKFDGAYIVNNEYYVAFLNTQIKLADGTNTTFDGSNPDIRYKDGGVTDIYTKKEIKKAYVSIRIKYDSEKKPDIKFFQEFQVKSIDLKPFQELSEGYLDGILGVSTSVHNVADWFSHRECLVVMPFDKFVEYNETEQIRYDDLASLTKNGLDVFFRLFDRKGRGENEYYDVLGNIFQRISRELDIDSKVSPMANKLEYASELFNTFSSRMFREYFAKQPRVNSPIDFAKITKEYINSGQAEKDGYYFRSVSEIDYSDVLPSIERGILASASAYKDESEWLILNKRLYVPEGSQLFFSLGGYENLQSKYEEVIDDLNLRKKYSIYFVKNEDIEKFRQIKYKEKDKIFQEQLSEAKSQINKKILVALESVTTDLILDYQKKVIKEITEYGSEYYIDEETNERYPSIFEIPQFINLFDLAFLKLNELMEAQFENVVKNKNKYHLVNAWNEYRLYIEKLIEENDGKEFDFVESTYHKVYIDWMYRHMKYAMNDIDIYEYMSRIKNKVGSDLYRYFSKDEISSLKYGGTTDKYQISDYWDEESFKDGGEVKTKKIITDKIGWNESVADYFIEQDPKLAIWLADGFMKVNLNQNLLPEDSSKEFFDLFGIKISDEATIEEWLSLPINIKKTLINDNCPTASDFELNGGFALGQANRQIRKILDWLKHPITPKQNLKELSIPEAIQKANKWHDELQAIGGDVDFIEPEENKKIIQYPIDDKEVEFYWVQIPKTFCDLESKRMGHCGRTGSGDSLISLRSIRPFGKGHTINDSHVTIAYNEVQGLFYQIKGKKNAKPSEKYFPYIFDLIRNFAIADNRNEIRIEELSKEIKEKVQLRDDTLIFLEKNGYLSNMSSSELNDFEKGNYKFNEEIIELDRIIYKLDQQLSKVKNNREFDEINREIENLNIQKIRIKDEIRYALFVLKSANRNIDSYSNEIEKLRKRAKYKFNGFGTEYASNEDYGWSDMSDSEIKQLYEINPELFKGLVGELLLYQRKLSANVPNMTFILKKDIYDLEDIIDFGRDLDPNFIKKVLNGDVSSGGWRSDKEVLDYYLEDLDNTSVEIIVDKISEITGLPKEEVSEDGIEYYLNGDYNEEHDKDFDFDSIFDRIKRAVSSSEESELQNHYYKIIKETLEELGEVIEIDDVWVRLKIDLLNLVSIDKIIETFNEIGETNDLAYLFELEIQSGDIDKPKLRLDDRYSPIATEEGINENFQSDDYFKDGGEVDNQKIFNYTDIDNFDDTILAFKDGGTIDDNKETYVKWKQLVNMSYSELNRFYNSEEGKKAGLTPSQASAQGIDSGRESARWILKMKKTPKSEWTPQMWKWAKKQISFISRMSGNKGKLYDDKGRKTRKYLSLLIWGNNPENMNKGGEIPNDLQDLLDEYRFKFVNVDKDGNYFWKKSLNYDNTYIHINFKNKTYSIDNKEFENYSLSALKKLFKTERLKQKSLS